jgi:predicted metal-dependent phosphoesterase TrpH
MIANCHIHLPPNFSAFPRPGDAVHQAKAEGVRILGTSNYYDFSVYAPFLREAQSAGIHVIPGIEILCRWDALADRHERANDPANPGKVYLCGKAISRYEHPSGRAAELLALIRERDGERMQRMTALLSQATGISLSASAITAEVAESAGVDKNAVTLQERHLAQAFQRALYTKIAESDRLHALTNIYGAPPGAPVSDAVATQTELRSRLMKAGKVAYVPEPFVSLEEGIELVLELGGVPAYPVVADGMNPRGEFESTPDTLVAGLNNLGIRAVEFIANRNSTAVLDEYALALSEAGFVLSCGTEHNTADNIPLTPKCRDGSVSDVASELFLSGALAYLAHGRRIAEGRPGLLEPTTAVEDLASEGHALVQVNS